MQAKDILERPILELLATVDRKYAGAGWHRLEPRADFCPTVADAVPADTPDKVTLAKMRSLIKRGLVAGCGCGCRGDFTLTDAGRLALATPEEAAVEVARPAPQTPTETPTT